METRTTQRESEPDNSSSSSYVHDKQVQVAQYKHLVLNLIHINNPRSNSINIPLSFRVSFHVGNKSVQSPGSHGFNKSSMFVKENWFAQIFTVYESLGSQNPYDINVHCSLSRC